MRPKSLSFFLSFLLLLAAAAPAASMLDALDPKIRAVIVEAPEPVYPQVAREIYLEGAGRFQLQVDPEQGKVTKVEVRQSTGYKELDAAAIAALRRWRVKPNTMSSILVPISFEMGGYIGDQLRAARKHAIYSPAPIYPYSLWRYGVHSGGKFQLTVDPKTGLVTDVKTLASSRVRPLDQSCLQTFRRWRFEPHTVSSVVISFSF